jgi:hypothetical protein
MKNKQGVNWQCLNKYQSKFTEEFLCEFCALDNFDNTRVQLLNAGDVVGKDTHITRGGSQVDLLNIGSLVNGLAKGYKKQ